GDLNVTGTSYLSNVTVNADNITVNEIHSREGNLTFYDNAQNERMKILSDGKIGIGTSDPQEFIEIQGTSSDMLTMAFTNTNSSAISMYRTAAGQEFGGIFGHAGKDYSDLALFTNKALLMSERFSDGLVVAADNGSMTFTAGDYGQYPVRAFINQTGQFGINTTSPTHTLHVVGDANISNNLYVGGTTNLGNVEMGDLTVDGDLNVTGISYLDDVTVNADNITVNEIHSRDGNLSFYDNAGTENVRFTEDGRVGIGTSSPDNTFQIDANESTITMMEVTNVNDAAGMIGSAVDFVNNNGTVGTFGILSSNFSLNILQNRAVVIGQNSGSGEGASNGVAISAATSNGNIVFTTTDSFTERMIIDSDGKVGIGNSNPQVMLHIDKDQNAETRIRINNTNSGANAGAFFESYNDLGQSSIFGLGSSTKMGLPIFSNHSMILTDSAGITLGAADSSGHIIFATGGTDERMRIESDGKVGIGTSSPSSILDIQKDIDDRIYLRLNNSNTSSSSGALIEITGGDSEAVYGTLTSTHGAAHYKGRAIVSGEGGSSAGVVIAASDVAGDINFHVNGSETESMTLSNESYLGINTTSPTSTLHSVGSFNITNSQSTITENASCIIIKRSSGTELAICD
ncbi:hypothetical protein ACFLZX_05365, partial [Nanoarchaeota archaeon]